MSMGYQISLEDSLANGALKPLGGVGNAAMVNIVSSTGTDIMSNSVSVANSTATNLGAGATFTGTAEDITKYAEVRVTVFASHASATDGLQMQQSSDGVNWDASDVFTIPAATNKTFGSGSAARYFRLVYTNGGTTTTSLRIQTTYHVNATKPSSIRPQDARTNDNDFIESMSYNAIYNGLTWDRARTPNVFKPLNAASVASEVTIWTPAAGKKFRIMGFCLTSGTVGGNVLFKDNTAGTTILVVPFGAANATIGSDGMGNGILSAAANNVLTATGVATQTISGFVFGTEE
jgi:hypothetical protein